MPHHPLTDTPKFRLALRVEGDWWNAYAAELGTMEGAILLGSIRMATVRVPSRKRAFMDLMQHALTDLLRGRGIETAGWTETTAPEHERSGRA